MLDLARPVRLQLSGRCAEVFVFGFVVEAEQIGRVEALLLSGASSS